MVYPFPERNRIKQNEVKGQTASGACSAGTITFPSNLPQGTYAVGWAVKTSGNDQAVVFTVTPWVDRAQTLASVNSYKFLVTGGTTATTNITMAITSTVRGNTGVLIPAGDQYGAAAPVIVVHGAEVTVGTTATTGTWELSYTAVEI